MIEYRTLAAVLAFQAPFICLVICIYYLLTLGRNGYTRMEHFLAKTLGVTCALCMFAEVLSGVITFGMIVLPNEVYIWSTVVSYFFHMLNAIIWSEFVLSRAHNPSRFLSTIIRLLYFAVFVVLSARIAFRDTKLFIYYEDGVAKYGILDDLQTYLCGLIYLLILIVMIIRYRDRSEYAYREIHGKIIFADSIILVAVTAYVLLYIPYLIWIGYMLVLLYIYMANQRSSIYKDELTHLQNRRSLIKDVSGKMKDDEKWSLIMIDINSFKSINDTFGHNEGDRAIEKVASILYDVAKEYGGETYRYGGDEFVIINNEAEEEGVLSICNEIDRRFEEANAADNLPYSLSVSSGYAIYNAETMVTIPDIMELADQRMYETKMRKKKQK